MNADNLLLEQLDKNDFGMIPESSTAAYVVMTVMTNPFLVCETSYVLPIYKIHVLIWVNVFL